MADFAPGDVVVCVDARQESFSTGLSTPCPLRAGGVYRVAACRLFPPTGVVGVILETPQSASLYGFHPIRFRKLNDGTDDAELIQRIKSCKPVRELVPSSRPLPAHEGEVGKVK